MIEASSWRRAPEAALRIGENLRALLRELSIHFGETVERHIDLAADLDPFRKAGTFELVRDILDCPDIFGDVLADPAVAARRRLGQYAIDIEDIARQAVDLGLGREGDRLVFRQFQEAFDALDELGDVIRREGIVERQHGDTMRHR